MKNKIMKAALQNPATTAAGVAGISILGAELDKVQTPKDWVMFGIKTILYLFMIASKDPWKK
jgi:hypothetical protein